MRPSKLRLPESTDTTARSPSSTASEISCEQRPGVADAGRAAVADEVEAELLERLGQPRAVEVLGHDLRARRERGLDPRLALQPARDRVAREEPGADHHRRVGGVRAAGDRRDHDVAVVELEASRRRRVTLAAPCRCAAARRRAALGQLRLRRRRERPRGPGVVGGRVGGREGLGDGLVLRVGLVAVARARSRAAPRWKTRLRLAERHAVLRALGPGEARLDRREVELERVGEGRLLRAARRATGPAPWRRPRRARSARAGGR